MAPGRGCKIARAGIEKSSNPIAAISSHLSKLPEMPQNLANPPVGGQARISYVTQKKGRQI